jgi:bis(5'-nucleosyl)-tetraphosphatase (symmetrical)
MASYVVGDIHGCARTLHRLLRSVHFSSTGDRLFLVGDLCNRGPDNVGVAAWILEHRHCVSTVLGNHDLHLLAVLAGAAEPRRRDTLHDLVQWSDRARFFDWLRYQALLDVQPEYVIVHAGLWPDWTLEQHQTVATAIERNLQTPDPAEFLHFLATVRGDCPTGVDAEPLATGAAVLTRMRCLNRTTYALNHEFKETRAEIPPDLVAWCDVERSQRTPRIFFGHWAALGHELTERYVALDSGCAWNGALTAFRLDDRKVFSQPFCET